MQQNNWSRTIFFILLVGAASCIQGHEITKEKRQAATFSIRIGPNDETILVINNQDVVFLTGNNAQCIPLMLGEVIQYASGILLVISSRVIGPFTDITEYRFLSETGTIPDLFGLDMVSPVHSGPGVLYVSDGLAFFTNNAINSAIAEEKATALPLRTQIQIRRTTSEGRPVSQLDVNNGNFTMLLTGSPTKIIGVAGDHRILYRSRTLTVEQGPLRRTVYNDIFIFAVLQLPPGTTDPQYTVFMDTTPGVVRGPGQVYVGVAENRAFFVEDFSFRGERDIIQSTINTPIFEQAFSLQDRGDTVEVIDSSNREVITLSVNTSKFDLFDADEVTYTGSEQTIAFVNPGLVNTFYVIQKFSIYDNNTLLMLSPPSSVTIPLCTGGTILVDNFERTAIFASNSNPVVISELCEAIPLLVGISYVYEIIRDSDDVRLLTARRRNITTTPASEEPAEVIQTVTGMYVIPILSNEAATYRNNEIIIQDSLGNTVKRIGEVMQFFVNTDSSTFGSFEDIAPIPFLGPGTLSYSRGTAFFTTDQKLGRRLSSESKRAPIPDIDFERVQIGSSIIDGVNYTELSIIQIIGRDRVISFEATSYTTSSDQEILYSGGQVTVHTPISTGRNVSYDGDAGTVTYTDTDGNLRIITGVDTFHEFSGGDVTTVSSGNTLVQRSGKLYRVSGDSILFGSSNIITPEVTGLIRQGMTDFSVNADQFSSIYAGMFNVSNTTAIITLPGGGIIWYSTFDGNRSFYVDNFGVNNRIRQTVSTFLPLTKSEPIKRQGIIRTIFNGRDVYSYSPVMGNRDVLILPNDFFVFNDTNLTGAALPGGPYEGINRVITFDGVEVKIFESSETPMIFRGFGLLLVQSDSDTAFFTTWNPTINYLSVSISNLEEFLVPPQLQRPRDDQITTKLRAANVRFGTDVLAYEGANITLKCKVKRGRPKPTVEFFRILENGDSMLLNESQMGVAIINNNTLMLSSIGIDDSGSYMCRADNNVPPAAVLTSVLTVREADAPLVRPGWLPFELRKVGQRIVWPSDPPVNYEVEVQVDRELVLACRVEGRPKAEVVWLFNGMDIETALGLGVLENSSANITEVKQGRSILTIDVTANRVILRGENVIQCSAANAGGSTSGTVILQGIIYSCEGVGFGECTATCGVGYQEVLFTCTREKSGVLPENITIDTVPEEVVSLLNRILICSSTDDDGNHIICPLTEFRWNTSEWSECTRTCGGGSRNRSVSCLNVSIPINSIYEALLNDKIETEVNETMCRMFERAGEKPTSRELCNTEVCPIWQAEEEFSECSVTCGIGVQERTVTCNIITGNYTDMYGITKFNLTVVNDSLCDDELMPVRSKECRTPRCFYHWLPGPFGECGDVNVSVPDEFRNCRQRGFTCYNGDPNPRIRTAERFIDDSFCADVVPYVSSLGSCNGGRCFNGIWEPLPWTECSESCGYGNRSRVVRCLSPLTLTLVDSEFCDVGTMPPPEECCFVRNCENTCLKDESSLCPFLESIGLCDSPLAMGDNGLRCCDTCLGLADDDEFICYIG